MSEPDLDALLDQIIEEDTDGLLDAPVKERILTTEDRLERGFLEIAEFYREYGRRPSSTTMDISERRLGARLDGLLIDELRASQLADLDDYGLLQPEAAPSSIDELLDGLDSELEDLLEVDEFTASILDTSRLPKRKADMDGVEKAQRVKAQDFGQYQPLFETKHAELAAGEAELKPFSGRSTIVEGAFFVLGGVMAFVAEIGETETRETGGRPRNDARLRVIFENGTESAMYRSSLAIRLGEQHGQHVVSTRASFNLADFGDEEMSGRIYVLSSLSDDPQIAGLQDLHKIGFTTTSVEQRIRGAEHEPTYLMAPVKVEAQYRLYNLRASTLEALLHRVFAQARLEINQVGADGRSYDPSEWFVVPLEVIDQAVDMIVSGDIVDFVYNRGSQALEYRPAGSGTGERA